MQLKYYHRAFRYVRRNKAKSLLLFFVLLTANSMILCALLILNAAKAAKVDLQEKTGSKLVCDVLSGENLLTDGEISRIAALDGVERVNRISSAGAAPAGFSPIAAPESGTADLSSTAALESGTADLPHAAETDAAPAAKEYIRIHGCDDLEADGPFAEKQLRLVEGVFPEKGDQIVVNKLLAEYNGLSQGDRIALESREGKQVTGEISGLFLSGSEEKQGKNVEPCCRLENQIYGSQEWCRMFSGEGGVESAVFYVEDPELLEGLEQQVSGMLRDKAEVRKSDTLYQNMKAPLNQIGRVGSLMLWLTIGTSIVAVTLLLSMWMRGRKRETAVYISMGEAKTCIYLQYLLETMMVYGASAAGALAAGSALAGGMGGLLLSGQENVAELSVSFRVQDGWRMIWAGAGVLLIGVALSLTPVLRANPRDVLAEMEG